MPRHLSNQHPGKGRVGLLRAPRPGPARYTVRAPAASARVLTDPIQPPSPWTHGCPGCDRAAPADPDPIRPPAALRIPHAEELSKRRPVPHAGNLRPRNL
jgi:hypothetical protein